MDQSIQDLVNHIDGYFVTHKICYKLIKEAIDKGLMKVKSFEVVAARGSSVAIGFEDANKFLLETLCNEALKYAREKGENFSLSVCSYLATINPEYLYLMRQEQLSFFCYEDNKQIYTPYERLVSSVEESTEDYMKKFNVSKSTAVKNAFRGSILELAESLRTSLDLNKYPIHTMSDKDFIVAIAEIMNDLQVPAYEVLFKVIPVNYKLQDLVDQVNDLKVLIDKLNINSELSMSVH